MSLVAMEFSEILEKLLNSFEGSFINSNYEFVAESHDNIYFSLKYCENLKDIQVKVINWISRSACKGQPYSQEWRNVKYRAKMLNGINTFLNTHFTEDDMEIIYTYCGNSINTELTNKFIDSNFNMSVFDEKR